ncbi:hypothetical protein ACFU8W_39160 [Streptomyces sp. NPDC057565]
MGDGAGHVTAAGAEMDRGGNDRQGAFPQEAFGHLQREGGHD